VSDTLPAKMEAEPTVFQKVFDRVLEERSYQRKRWTSEHDKKHSPLEWSGIMSVWNGKVAKATHLYRNPDDPASLKEFKKRVTQLAAICIAALESVEEG